MVVVLSPDPGSYAYALPGVACISSNQCVAVGSSSDSDLAPRTLVESWNGTAWSVVPSPSPGRYGDWLDAVSCTSLFTCDAVGLSVTGKENNRLRLLAPTKTLVESPFGITTPSLPRGTVGQVYSANLGAAGGSTPYVWTLVPRSGKLPVGRKLDKNAGTITGTPKKTSVTSTFTIEVLDTKGASPPKQNTATAIFTIATLPAP